MDGETQRLFTIALIGLLLFFPVFNQVAQTAVDTLTEADHQAQLSDFFKDWDSVPDHHKLEYWDGRNPPPEHWGEGERPEDVRTRGGSGTGQEGGPGSGEGENGEGPGEGEEEQEVEYVTEVIWSFTGEGSTVERVDNIPQNDYHWVNVTWQYSGFNGNADFALYAGNDVVWDDLQEGGDVPAVLANQDNTTQVLSDIGTAPMQMDFRYDPVGSTFDFEVVVTGTYPVN